jgi:tripartite ATP-independent transporter DctP family solute receptor
MNKLLRAVLGTIVLASSLAPLSLATAQDVKDRNFKLALANTAESAHGVGAKRFADVVGQKSGGKMKVRIYAGGSLGGEAVVASALQGGTIEMSMMGPGLLTGMDKDFGIFDTPFMFNDAKEADAVMDGPVGRRLLDRLPEKGLIGLSYWDHGFRVLTNSRRPVAKMEDIQGLKLRVQQIPVFIDTFAALGANPVPMAFTELYTAMETKAVDGQENPFVSVEVTKFYEVQRYASNTRHAYSPLLVLVSKRFWDQLSADERKILQDAATETKAFERETSRAMDAKAMEELKSKGMTITDISPAERARMRDKLKPAIEKHHKTISEALVQEVNAELQKVRGGS